MACCIYGFSRDAKLQATVNTSCWYTAFVHYMMWWNLIFCDSIFYSSGSAKATVPTVPVPQHWALKYRGHLSPLFCSLPAYRLPVYQYTRQQCCGSILVSMRIQIRIQIQGCDKTKNWKKFTAGKFLLIFFDQKLQFTYSYASIEAVQATGEAFIPQKWTSSNLKLEFSSLLWVILTLLDPDPDPYSLCGSGSSRPKWMRIRIRILTTARKTLCLITRECEKLLFPFQNKYVLYESITEDEELELNTQTRNTRLPRVHHVFTTCLSRVHHVLSFSSCFAMFLNFFLLRRSVISLKSIPLFSYFLFSHVSILSNAT